MGLLSSIAESALRGYARIAPTERGGFHLVKAARRLRPVEQWRDCFCLRGGLRMELDLATYPDFTMAFGLYELDTLRLFRRLLKPGDHFVDVGANIGYFTLHAACWVGPHGKVDAFEPQPHNGARLRAHLRLNGFENKVAVHAQAVSDRAGEAIIHFPISGGLNHGQSSLFAPAGAQTQPHPVSTIRLDEALPNASPRLIKIDVEGAEPLVIRGMEGLLRRGSPAVVMEYNPTAAADAGYSPGAGVQMLLNFRPDYRCWHIGARLKPVDIRRVERGQLRQGNLLLACAHP